MDSRHLNFRPTLPDLQASSTHADCQKRANLNLNPNKVTTTSQSDNHALINQAKLLLKAKFIYRTKII